MMIRRTSLLSRLRRQGKRLGRFVLAIFALASFTSAGAHCFAMVPTASLAQADENPHAEIHADTHAHEYAMSHGDRGADADEQTKHDYPDHCPHCPLAGAMADHVPSNAHAFCSAFDDASDHSSSSLPALAKHVVPVAAFELIAPLAFHPPPRPRAREVASTRRTVALNVRHCVFLI
jgi:hypothetical protein